MPVLSGLRAAAPERTLLLTTGTTTAAKVVDSRRPDGMIHQFAPVDTPAAVARFLDYWRPSLAVWVESELWPNTLSALRRREIPSILVNARMSERSFRRWQMLRGAAPALLRAFSTVLAQSPADARRFQELGAQDVREAGNLKFAAEDLPYDPTTLATVQAAVGQRPLWVAASTHPGEESMVAAAHRRLSAQHPGLLTVIVPRHPERGQEIAVALGDAGYSVALRSRGGEPDGSADLYLADTVGELGVWYRLCPVSFVGGSLVPHGGHNPIEPLRLGCRPVVGPYTHNFADVVRRLQALDAVTILERPEELAEAVGSLLRSSSGNRAAAQRIAAEGATALAAVLTAIQEVVPPAGAGRRA